MRSLPIILSLSILMLAGGCATYRLGACSLYRPDIQTVHIPIARSASFRRNLGERLTEAVVKQVELNTPYKVVGAENADSTLLIQLDNDSKRTLQENGLSEARTIETRLAITMTWRDSQGNLITRSTIPIEDTIVGISAASNYIPEGGQSGATSQQKAIEQLAIQIVGQMEAAW